MPSEERCGCVVAHALTKQKKLFERHIYVLGTRRVVAVFNASDLLPRQAVKALHSNTATAIELVHLNIGPGNQ